MAEPTRRTAGLAPSGSEIHSNQEKTQPTPAGDGAQLDPYTVDRCTDDNDSIEFTPINSRGPLSKSNELGAAGASAKHVDVDTFLDTIFEDVPPEQGVIGASYPHATDPKGGWRHRRWVKGQPLLDPRAYYFPTTLMPVGARDTRLRATEDRRGWCYCIVLDDVVAELRETKKFQCPRDKVKLKPSYILETSAGNYQYGYILEYPVPVLDADAIVLGLVAAKLTDGGRTNRAAHLMRVPGSHNVKHNPPFVARLVEWHPELMYTLSQVAVGLGAVPQCVPKAFDGAALAAGDTDPVFDWLVSHGIIVGDPSAAGWYPVICPWADDHSKGDGGADYHPGNPGGFSCLHSHCLEAGRTTATLKAWIKEQDPKADFSVIPAALWASVGASLNAIFNPVSKMTLRARLGSAIAEVRLGPTQLPDCDMTAKGLPALSQGISELRVETVMRMIGAEAHHNAMNGTMELTMRDVGGLTYKSTEDTSGAGLATIVHVCLRCRMRGDRQIIEAVHNIAKVNEYHPAERWMEQEPWDGTDRLEALYASVVLRDPAREAWKRVAIRRWLIQTVVAIKNYRRTPVDVGYVLTLQGPQGVGKSRWVGSLMPDEFVTLGLSMKLDSNERDAVRRATRAPICELGELDHSFKRSDQSALKNFLTTRVDVYRDAYGRTETAKPRCTVFAATVNPEGFLLDQTGERRFWPIGVKSCDWAHGINVQQLWAQAAVLEARGEQYWLTPREEKMHAEASAVHKADSDVGYIMEDLKMRAAALPESSTPWVHANAKAIVAHYNFAPRIATWMDLNSALEKWGAKPCKTRGKRGWMVPPFDRALTAAELQGLTVVK